MLSIDSQFGTSYSPFCLWVGVQEREKEGAGRGERKGEGEGKERRTKGEKVGERNIVCIMCKYH